jgi:hypothetical protein
MEGREIRVTKTPPDTRSDMEGNLYRLCRRTTQERGHDKPYGSNRPAEQRSDLYSLTEYNNRHGGLEVPRKSSRVLRAT